MGVFEETFLRDTSVMSTSGLSSLGYSVNVGKTNLISYNMVNATSVTRYVKIYNVSGAVNVGTDTPVFRTALVAGEAQQFTPTVPVEFSKGMSVVATSGATDDGIGNIVAGDIQAFVIYK